MTGNRITRRQFLMGSAATIGAAVMGACKAPRGAPEPSPTMDWRPMEVTRPGPPTTPTPDCDASTFRELPPALGQRYLATVPDTFDLQPRAELVLRTMTNCTAADESHAPYDRMNLWSNPPVMHGTTTFNGKYIEATGLLRHITGSTENQQVDQAWRTGLLNSMGDYGWWWGCDCGRILAWLGDNFRVEKNPCWRIVARQVLNRMSETLVHEDDYSYYPDQQGHMMTGWDATDGGWVLQGLTVLFLATQEPEALRLASRLARYLKDHAEVFDSEGHFLARHPSDKGPALHFHHTGNVLEGMSAYAAASGDLEYAQFAKRSYEWARSLGAPLVGFFPEYINDWPDDRPIVDCETCCTGDMIQIAMNLSEANQGDYWDDVDRYVRNQFAEMQLLDSRWIDEMVQALPPTQPEPGDDADRVSERIVGSFSSWATPNDWYIGGSQGTTFCCIGNGARVLYYVWDKMLQHRRGTLTLNLLLNRASSWADVNSLVPYEGRVEVLIKAPSDLEIRIPEWVQPRDLSCSINAAARELETRGRYALVGPVGPGDLVTLAFPISERVIEARIANLPYTLTIKGNDVVAIEPSGKWYPFYQRAHYREAQARWIDRERFVPNT